jgi:hypothetical protein
VLLATAEAACCKVAAALAAAASVAASCAITCARSCANLQTHHGQQQDHRWVGVCV